MIADAIRDCSNRGGLILDPFGGAGTTLIAAEQTGRRARVIELDPIFVDISIERWQRLTGGTATHADSGQPFARSGSSSGGPDRVRRMIDGQAQGPRRSTGGARPRLRGRIRQAAEACRFRPGQSGNPAGRRKGVRNLVTDVQRMLATPVKVKEGGRTRTRSTQEAALMVLRDKALRGDVRALELCLELARRFNNEFDRGRNIPGAGCR